MMVPSLLPPSVVVMDRHHPKAVCAGRGGLGDAAGTLGRESKGPGSGARSQELSSSPKQRHGVIQATALPRPARQYEQTQEPKCSKQFWSDFQRIAQQQTMLLVRGISQGDRAAHGGLGSCGLLLPDLGLHRVPWHHQFLNHGVCWTLRVKAVFLKGKKEH